MNEAKDLSLLEQTLVREFRTCQHLLALVKQERTAMITNDSHSLLDLLERKEALLDEIGRLEDQRRMYIQSVSTALDMPSETPTLLQLAERLAPENAIRITNIYQGIETLLGQVRSLNHGNRALALSALEWIDAAQAFLLHLYHPQREYAPSGRLASYGTPATLELDQLV